MRAVLLASTFALALALLSSMIVVVDFSGCMGALDLSIEETDEAEPGFTLYVNNSGGFTLEISISGIRNGEEIGLVSVSLRPGEVIEKEVSMRDIGDVSPSRFVIEYGGILRFTAPFPERG